MHVSQLTHEPNPDGTCRACRSPVNPETMLCVRCGAAYGEKNRCPHCRTIARTLPHPTLHHRCSVCGKPRLPPGPSTRPPRPEVQEALRSAAGAHKNAQLLRVLSFVFSGMGLFLGLAVLLFLWVADFGLSGNVIGLFVALVPWLLTVYSQLAAKGARRSRDEALQRAYSEQVVALLYELGSSSDSTRIAAWLGLSVERTEGLLAKLNTDDRMTSEVTDEGEVVYGVATPEHLRVSAQPMLRVDPSFADRPQAPIPSPTSELIEAEFIDDPRTESKPQHRS